MTTRTTTKTAPRASAASKTATKTTQTRKAPVRASTTKAGMSRGTASKDEVDSPILPVDQLDALRKIKPDAVDWVIQQTQAEAEHRRAEQVRVNNLIFVEHLFSQAAALIVGVAGVGGGVWLVQQGQVWPGVAIAAVVMVALAVVQVAARSKR